MVHSEIDHTKLSGCETFAHEDSTDLANASLSKLLREAPLHICRNLNLSRHSSPC